MVSDKRQVKEVGGKEGRVSAYSSRAIESLHLGGESVVAGKRGNCPHDICEQEAEGALVLSCKIVFRLRSQVMELCHPQLGWSSHLCQEEETGNSLTDTGRGFPCVSEGVLILSS